MPAATREIQRRAGSVEVDVVLRGEVVRHRHRSVGRALDGIQARTVSTVDRTWLESVRCALREDRTIDIVTRGARSGARRSTEIWFTNIGDEIFICGTPAADGSAGPTRGRDWLANLAAHPEFEFVLKESVAVTLPAVGTVITDRDERTRVFSAPQTCWYRDQTGSLSRLVDEAPLVRVTFVGDALPLNGTE